MSSHCLTMEERYSDNLSALEASFLGEKQSVLQEMANDDIEHCDNHDTLHDDADNSEDELEDAPKPVDTTSRPPLKDTTKIPSSRTKRFQGQCNTGVKGVLADYHEAQRIKAEEAASARLAVKAPVVYQESVSFSAAGDRRELVIPNST